MLRQFITPARGLNTWNVQYKWSCEEPSSPLLPQLKNYPEFLFILHLFLAKKKKSCLMTLTFNGLYSLQVTVQIHRWTCLNLMETLCFSCGYFGWKNKIPYHTLHSHYSTEHVLCQLSVSGNYEVTQFYFPGKNNMRRAKGVCAASSWIIPVLELVAHPMDHSPHLRCSPVLEGYQLEECQILCHRSVYQKP